MSSGQQQRPDVPEIDPREAWRRAERGEAVIVDVREPEEIAEVAVPGAVHIPLGDLQERVGEIPADREVLFLCRSGNRSSYATDFYRHRVGPNAENVRGGILAWEADGLPVRTGQSSQES